MKTGEARARDAAGYIRCSTDMQEDSPAQQEREIRAYAERNGYALVGFYIDEGRSGTSFDERPEFKRLLSDVERGANFTTVICYDESRWGRAIDAEENTYWRVHFKRYGVQVLLVKTLIPGMDSDHEFAPMMKAFEIMQASSYSKKLSELTLRGTKANKKFSNGGTAPYGYRRVAVDQKTGAVRDLADKGRIIKGQEKVSWALGDPSEVAVVKKIFALRLEGKGYIAIARHLNALNVPCPKRGRWRNKDQKWSGVTIKSILENPSYFGTRAYNRSSMSKIQAGAKGRTVTRGVHYPHWKNGKHDWILEPNAHEPTVSEEDWAAVNAMVRDTGKERSASYNGVSPYLLSGLLRCSRCGFNFQGWSGKAKGHQYYRYVDGGWKNKGVCSHFALDRDALEAFVLSCVREVASDESFMDDIERSLERFVTGQSEQLKEERDQTLRKLERCEEDIRNITDAIAQGYRNESLKEKLTELERQKADHKRHISSLVPERRSVRKVLGLADRIRAFMADFEQKYEAASIPEKKLLLRLWVKDVLVEHDKKAVCVNVRNIPLIEGGADLEEALEHKKSAHNGESCERESSGDRNIRKPKIEDRRVEVPFRIIRKRGGARRHQHSI